MKRKTSFYTITTVLFDFNGTIVKDHKIAWKVVSRIFEYFGIVPLTLQQFRYEFHFPYWTIFKNHGLSDKQARQECRKLYARFYEEELEKIRLFPDAKNCLKELKDLSYKLGLVSQSHRLLLDYLLKKLEIAHYFGDNTISLDDCVEQKPNPLPLLICAEKIGVAPRNCVYFGDMVEDQYAAQSARMFRGAVASKGSYHPLHVLQGAGPDILVSNLKQIPESVLNLENSLQVAKC